jgi:hypothetical protein
VAVVCKCVRRNGISEDEQYDWVIGGCAVPDATCHEVQTVKWDHRRVNHAVCDPGPGAVGRIEHTPNRRRLNMWNPLPYCRLSAMPWEPAQLAVISNLVDSSKPRKQVLKPCPRAPINRHRPPFLSSSPSSLFLSSEASSIVPALQPSTDTYDRSTSSNCAFSLPAFQNVCQSLFSLTIPRLPAPRPSSKGYRLPVADPRPGTYTNHTSAAHFTCCRNVFDRASQGHYQAQ